MNTTKHARTKVCKGVGNDGVSCTQTTLIARGYCERCYNILRTHCIANGSWPVKRGEEIPKPPMVPWTYEPTPEQEAELIRLVEEQDRQKKELVSPEATKGERK